MRVLRCCVGGGGGVGVYRARCGHTGTGTGRTGTVEHIDREVAYGDDAASVLASLAATRPTQLSFSSHVGRTLEDTIEVTDAEDVSILAFELLVDAIGAAAPRDELDVPAILQRALHAIGEGRAPFIGVAVTGE